MNQHPVHPRLNEYAYLDSLRGQTKKCVSLITAVRNGERTLQRTIDSVTNQTFTDIEYIVIDGASTDKTPQIIEKSKAIAISLSEADKGIYDAFNKGVCLSSGEIIGIINADDWYEPDAIALIVRYFADNPDTEVVCGLVKYWKNDLPDYVFESSFSKMKLRRENTVNHPSVFVRRHVYQNVGLFNLGFGFAGDYDFFIRCSKAGLKMDVIPVLLANMALGGASSSGWVTTYRNFLQVQLANFSNKPYSYYLYFYHLLRTAASATLSKVGLGIIVAVYRNKFSILKKKRVHS